MRKEERAFSFPERKKKEKGEKKWYERDAIYTLHEKEEKGMSPYFFYGIEEEVSGRPSKLDAELEKKGGKTLFIPGREEPRSGLCLFATREGKKEHHPDRIILVKGRRRGRTRKSDLYEFQHLRGKGKEMRTCLRREA